MPLAPIQRAPRRQLAVLARSGILRIAVLVTLLALIPGYFYGRYRQQEWRYQAWQRDARVRAALQQPVRLVVDDPQHRTLQQAVEQLSRQVRVPIELDQQIASAPLDPQHLIVRNNEEDQGIYQGSLESVLIQLMNSADTSEILAYRVAAGRIEIAIADDNQLFVQTHPIQPAAPEKIVLGGHEVAPLIATSVDLAMWDIGEGIRIGTWAFSPSPGGVTCSASSDGHRGISLFLQQLADLPAQPESLRPVSMLDTNWAWPYEITRGESRVLKVLDQQGSFSYAKVPLRQFLWDISSRFDLPVMIAARNLEEAAVPLDIQVTIELPKSSLRDCLRQALSEVTLSYFVNSEAVIVTVPEEIRYRFYFVAYPVHDLLELEPDVDKRRILDLITSLVDSDSWADVGGGGSIEPLSHGWLLVSQSEGTHAGIERFLSELRHEARSSFWPSVGLEARKMRTDRIETALRRIDRVHGDVLPLSEFASQLQRQLDFPVTVQRRKLDEAAMDLEMPICCHRAKEPLWRWLRETLAQYNLSFRFDEKSLLITTPEDAGSRLNRAIYNLRDLTMPEFGPLSKQTITSLLVHSIDPDSWEPRGGPASFSWLGDCLIVCQDDLTQFEVYELLEYLREHQADLPRLAEIQRLDKTSAEYLRLVQESETSTDRWRSAWLRFALGTPLPPPVQIGPFGSGMPSLR